MNSYLIHLYHITSSKLLLSYKYGIYPEFACIESYFEFACVPICEYNIPEKAQWNV